MTTATMPDAARENDDKESDDKDVETWTCPKPTGDGDAYTDDGLLKMNCGCDSTVKPSTCQIWTGYDLYTMQKILI